MTPLDLQDALVSDIKKILVGHKYKTPAGKMIPINVFAQNIPVNESDDDEDPIPYIIVRLNTGEDLGAKDSNYVIGLVIIIGIWDDALDSQGHRTVLNIINKIYERFQKNPSVGDAIYTGEFHWANQEDGYYPYYFGACTLSFNIPAIRREDPYA